jgi:S-adenosylmethionine:tRNA ribosyltransferase-isomerase
MLRSDFHFDLPKELIAQEPRVRGRSRMMLVGRAGIRHASFADFPAELRDDDVIVLNDTKVFPARLYAQPKGAMQNPIELLLTRKRAPLVWECWCKPARRIRPGDVLLFSERLTGTVEEKNEGTVVVRFEAEGGDFWGELERSGATPLPPYIERDTPHVEDREAYQTVYAARRGAIAAPTAGLHFTPEILAAIEARGIAVVRITLHVGIGTFKPVKVDDIGEHRMESEWYEISGEAAETINMALDEGRRIVAIGTTTTRALESAAVEGNGRVPAGARTTSIFITPGYRFQVVSRLLTNFHLPESTLLMLVSAFAGMETIRAAYAEAIRERYLFYSFGDCMLLERQ